MNQNELSLKLWHKNKLAATMRAHLPLEMHRVQWKSKRLSWKNSPSIFKCFHNFSCRKTFLINCWAKIYSSICIKCIKKVGEFARTSFLSSHTRNWYGKRLWRTTANSFSSLVIAACKWHKYGMDSGVGVTIAGYGCRMRKLLDNWNVCSAQLDKF